MRPPSAQPQRGNDGFSLIEILTVIAIIGVLMGLLFPVLRAARRNAKEGKAKIQISQLSGAILAYYNEYALWPTNPPTGVIDGVVWAGILSGKDTANNPRKIVFLEFKSTETDATGILDPWRQPYKFGFDTNYDRQIDISASLPGGANTNTDFIIWSDGDPSAPRLIASWQ